MKKTRFALIGCSRISTRHIEAICGSTLGELAIVCDVIPERMEQALATAIEKGTAPERVQDYKKVLTRSDIDAIALCTASGNHASIAIDALNAGKHVLVEKPMALSTTDADAMITLAEQKELQLGVCHQNRFYPSVRALRQALDTGMFGKLLHGVASTRWTRDAAYYAQAPWRGTWAQDGGTLMNQCIHNIDLLQWMLGDVDHLYAQTDRFLRPIEAEDTGVAVLRFKNGALGIIEGTTCVFPKNLEETLSIFGSTGTACLGGTAINKIETWNFQGMSPAEVASTRAKAEDVDSVSGKGHEPLYSNFIEAINGHAKLLVDGREGKKALEVVLAIYKSARTGQPVKFPLGAYSTLTDLEGYR